MINLTKSEAMLVYNTLSIETEKLKKESDYLHLMEHDVACDDMLNKIEQIDIILEKLEILW